MAALAGFRPLASYSPHRHEWFQSVGYIRTLKLDDFLIKWQLGFFVKILIDLGFSDKIVIIQANLCLLFDDEHMFTSENTFDVIHSGFMISEIIIVFESRFAWAYCDHDFELV